MFASLEVFGVLALCITISVVTVGTALEGFADRRLLQWGIDVGDTRVILAASSVCFLAYAASNSVMTRFVYTPLGLWAARAPRGADVPQVLAVKFPAWSSAFVAHCVQWVLFLGWAHRSENSSWVLHWKTWANGEVLSPRIDDEIGRRTVGPMYIMYFAYVLHSCYKDMLKTAGRKGGALQILFYLHHVITVLLVASSINYGTWRAGVLTRIIHDPADIVVYWSKCYQAMYECRKGSFWGGFLAILADVVVWFFTRIIAYSYLVYALYVTLLGLPQKQFSTGAMVSFWAQIVGCGLMLILQIVFWCGISGTLVKFWTQGGVVDDPFHGKQRKKTS